MDPTTETRLWPHEHNEVYRAFDRIFSCQGHGWANLQATHLNLPFQGDAELRALHTAIRAVLPLLPALAASSPILDGAPAGSLDRRMIEYRKNSRRVPSVGGQVVPDVVASRAEYEERILGPIYFDLAPHDPEGILRHEWVNARGAIARFERGTVEIRVLDVQECPAADLALVGAVCRVVHRLCGRMLDGDDRAYRLRTDELSALLDVVVRDAERARVDSSEYHRALGLPQARSRSAGEVWRELLEGSEPGPWEASASARDAEGGDPLGAILGEGPLGRRILARLGPRPCREELREVYRELADCLASNRIFHGP
jgi:hypothetical protein